MLIRFLAHCLARLNETDTDNDYNKPVQQNVLDMTQQENLNKFLELICNRLKLSGESVELAMDADLNSMGLDSSSALNLMLDLEEEFGVFFPESMFTEETFETPNSLWKSLQALQMQ
jgi:acyl carrier protein